MDMIEITAPTEDLLYNYYRAIGIRETELLSLIREETNALPDAHTQITPEMGQFFGLMIELIGAQKALEVGVYTGYSGLCIAQALPFDGKFVACEINREYAQTALRYWREAGIERKVDLRVAPALETLDILIEDGYADTFDFLFIDADKKNYDRYYERCLILARSGGLIAINSILCHGRTADPEDHHPDVAAIRRLNDKIHDDNRVSISTLPVGDGLTLARKR
jgi:predicted O-methyltransferase YrrM